MSSVRGEIEAKMYIDKSSGYAEVYVPSHPFARKGNGRVREHVLVAEHALGYYLPIGVEVHHVNGLRHENVGTNLVVCQDRAYHRLLHRRADALRACGNTDHRKCQHCQEWCPTDTLRFYGTAWHHVACRVAYSKRWRGQRAGRS